MAALSFDESAGANAPSAFGPFRVLHQIGSGVLGPVFRTYDPQRDRLVAVKAFKLDIVPEDVALLAEALRRLAAMPTPAGLVSVVDAGLEGTTAFIAMEYVAGETFDVALRHIAPASLDRALPMLTRIAEAIDASWAAGYGHGTLHPRDVFLAHGTADIVVTGAGIARALESVGVKPPVRRPYASPERSEGLAWDIRSDVYSVGAIAHELLTRRRPAGPGEQDGEFAGSLTPEQRVLVRRILAGALAAEPDQRFASAGEFVAALTAAARGEEPATVILSVSPVSGATSSTGFVQPSLVLDAPSPTPPPADDVPPAEAETKPYAVQEASRADHPEPPPPAPAEVPTKPTPIVETSTWEPDRDFAVQEALRGSTWRGPRDLDLEAKAGLHDPSSANAGWERPEKTNATSDTAGTHWAARTTLDFQPAAPAAAPARVEPIPTPEGFGWIALVSVAIACISVGTVFGFYLGQRGAAPAAVVAAPAIGAPTDTDVPVAREPVRPVVTPEPTPLTVPPETPVTRPPPVASPAPTPPKVEGTLIVKSNPTGASVMVNGRGYGSTPRTIRGLPLDSLTVQVSRSGFTPDTRKVTLSASSPSREVTVKLAPIASRGVPAPGAPAGTGTLSVNTRPSGARVSVDGKSVGLTPVAAISATVGTHTVRIELAGYRTITTTVTVKAGENTPLSLSLEIGGPNY